MKFFSALFTAALFAGASASSVIDLDPSNFDSIVGQGKPGLVEFFAPWCGHCKKLAPIYEEVADAFAHKKGDVYVAKVDADANKELGGRFGVSSYPTLKWFNADGTHEPYESGRDLEALTAFITQKTGVKSSIKPPPPPAYTILDATSFDDVALDPTKDVLVSFTAPWCGHCKNMKPHYEKVAKTFENEGNCIIANVDADDKKNKDLAKKYGVTGYPTLKFFSKDNKEPEAYEGGRTEADFVQFLNEKCGTQRAVGGGLNDLAGRIPAFDVLASKLFTAAADLKDAIVEEARQLLTTDAASTAKYYLKVMEKELAGPTSYVQKESARLGSILKKRTLSSEKLDEIQVKVNILKAFQEAPKKEQEPEAESEHDASEL